MGTYSYDNLSTYIIEMTDAAITSMMNYVGFGGSTDKGFHGGLGGPGGPEVNIGPNIGGGRYEGSTFVAGGQVTDVYGEPSGMTLADIRIEGGWPFETVQGLIDYFTTGVSEAFEPWWQIPYKGAFDEQMNACQSAAKTLAMSDNIVDASQSKHSGTAPLWGANTDLSSAMTISTGKLEYFDGRASDAFQFNVTSRLNPVTAGQDAVATILYVAAAGESSIWDKTRESLAEIAGQGVEAMKAANGSGGGFTLEKFLMVVGAVALVAAPFTGGASEAAFGVAEGTATAIEGATNAVGVVTQTASVFAPEKEEKEEPLKASDPVGVLDNVRKALNQLKTAIGDEESGIQKGCSHLKEAITSQASKFNLRVLPSTSQLDPTRDSNAADFGEFVVDPKRVNELADALTDGVPGVMNIGVTLELTRARNSLANALGPGPWARPAGIGLGGGQPYAAYAQLVDTLWSYLDDSINYVNDSAAVLRIVARDAQNVDRLRADLTTREESVESRKPVAPPDPGIK